MNRLARYIIIAAISAVVIFIIWYFINIIAYILIAAILSLIGRPVVEGLGKIRIHKYKIPKWFRALLALLFIWFIFLLFFRIFIPLIANEANELSNVNINPLLSQLDKPLEELNSLFVSLGLDEGKYDSLNDYISEKISSVLNISLLSSLVGTLTGLMGDLFIAVFAISFITFFFLKDDKMFGKSILLLVPSKHENAVRNALESIRKLLMRYFIGIVLQITAIIILVTLGLSIVGVEFQRSIVIGLFIGIINVIPYVGPFIGAIFGLIIGSAGYIEMDLTIIITKMIYMAVVFLSVQLIDNIFFQPFIYGSSVNAHPLEIFLVIMVAGSAAGIPGMILAIPSYIIFRVFAREFLYKFKVIKKITEKIN